MARNESAERRDDQLGAAAWVYLCARAGSNVEGFRLVMAGAGHVIGSPSG